MTLYVVATPIGNLSDMSPRAVDTLRSVALIAAEDTRVTMKLLAHFDIRTPMTSCHQHNEQPKARAIVDRMMSEQIDVALVTDAGTPAISDPGTALVRAAAERGVPVVAVAGPSAMAAAMSVSGFDLPEFTFYGFLPREKKALEDKLTDIARKSAGAILHESPFRVVSLMRAVARTLPGALVSASCDLTKLHELTLRGTAEAVLAALEANEKTEKGEYCLVLDLRGVSLPAPAVRPDISLEARLFDAVLRGLSLRDAQNSLVEAGEKKNAVYAAALRVKERLRDEA